MLCDIHNHSEFSFDSERTMRSVINEAVSAGIEVLGFSDHLDFSPGDPGSDYYNLSKQLEQYDSLQKEFAGRISLRLGIEASYEDYYYEKTKAVLDAYSFDYVIMSVHFVEKLVISEWIEKLEKDAEHIEDVDYAPYFEQMKQTIENSDFDILGHIDYYKKYSKFSHEHTFKRYRHYYEKILRALIKRNRVIEINTSGLRHKCSEQFPSTDILELYKSLGGKTVAIGSDSHNEGQTGFSLASAEKLINKYGFDKFIPRRNNGNAEH